MKIIEVKNLKKYFGKTKAIDGISFAVEKGEIFGFLGPNGAGKTTTIRCLMDFIRPTEGFLTLLGQDAQKDAVALKNRIGFLSGGINLYDKWTGQDHLDFVRKIHRHRDIADELVKRFDFNPRLKTKNLSSGNKQKLGVILAFMFQPELLILDEPTNALDPLLQGEVYRLLDETTKRGATVFMSSHNLAEVERVCSRVGIIRSGKMVAMESLISLQEKQIHSVQVLFQGQFNKNDFILDGVKIDKELPNGLILGVKGDINPLIKQFNKYRLRDLQITHATLEEIFMEFYQEK